MIPLPRRPSLALSLAAVALVAIALRGWHVGSILASPIGEALVGDADHYQREAARILEPAPTPGASGPGFMNPGYPYAVAAIGLVFGSGIAKVLWVQALLGALAAVLVALAASILFGDPTRGLVAGLFYAAYAGAIFYDGMLLTPSLTNLALAATLLGAAVLLRSGGVAVALASGIGIGLAVLIRPNLALAVPLVAIVIVLTGERPLRRRLGLALAFVAVASAPAAAVVLNNGLRHGAWAPITTNGGMNFWTGNNRQAQGVYYAAPFVFAQNAQDEERAFLAEARRRTRNSLLTPAEASSYWLREGLREIAADPRRWLLLEGRKAMLFGNRAEPKTNVGLDFLRDFSPVLDRFSIGFAILAVLGSAGLLLLMMERRLGATALLLCFVAAPLGTCLLFFVSGEYRHPASLALAPAAAVALTALPGLIRRGPRGRVAWAAVAGLATTAVVVWPFTELAIALPAQMDYDNYARSLCTGAPSPRDGARRALALLDRAPAELEGDPQLLVTRLWVHTWTAVKTGDRAEAERALGITRDLTSREIRPGIAGLTEGSARAVHISRERLLAELAALDAVREDRDLSREADLLGANGYAECDRRFARGDLGGARDCLDEALAMAPHHVGLQAGMGRVLLALGLDDEGLAWLRKSFAGWPPIPEPAFYTGEYYASRGDGERARAALEEALRRDETFRPARDLLRRVKS